MRHRWIDWFVRSPTSLMSRARIRWMRMCGARIGPRCRFEAIRWRQADQIEIGRLVAITHGTFLYLTLRNVDRPGSKIVIGSNVPSTPLLHRCASESRFRTAMINVLLHHRW